MKHILFATVSKFSLLYYGAVLTIPSGCRKGKRECTYPGDATTPTSLSRSSKSGSRGKDSPGASSPSGSEIDVDEKELLPSIPDDEEEDDSAPASATLDRRKASDASTPSRETSATSKGSHPTRTSSKQSIRSEIFQNPRWSTLPKEVKTYLRFHHEHMSHHHYAFKYDGGNFLKTTFLEIAMNDGSAALLYAIVAFAAYHHAVAYDDGNISVFLAYYNKSIAFLQQSLKRQRHSVATLLTILQLATIEVSVPWIANDSTSADRTTGVSWRLGQSPWTSEGCVFNTDRPVHSADNNAR